MKSVAQTVIEADRFYTIAAKTGSVIQAVENAKDGGDIRLGKYDHKPEQEWAFVREGDGVYRIRNRASGKLIDLMMTGTANGTWLHLWEDVGGTSQMWKMEPTPAGTVRLRSMWAAGKCIDTVGMGTADGAVLQIWQETAGEDQLWTISEVKDRAKHAPKAEEKPAACTCAEKCQAGAVNTACPVCAVNMSECDGKAPEVEPEKESGSSGVLVLILLLAALGGGAFAYIKFIKPKQGAKVSTDPDDYEFEDEEYENEDEQSPSGK